MKQITYFVADDGTQFDNALDCLEYEHDKGNKLRKDKLKTHIINNYHSYWIRSSPESGPEVEQIVKYIWNNWAKLVDIVEG